MSMPERIVQRSGSTAPWRQHAGGFARALRCLGLSFAIVAYSTSAGALQEGGNKLQLAMDIQKGFLQSLNLKGMTAEEAIVTMLAEGFRCKIDASDRFGLVQNPLATCTKQPSGFGELCEKLVVMLDFDSLSGSISREAMLGQLHTIRTKFGTAFCPYLPTVSAEFLAMRSAAEAELSRHVESLGLSGRARAVFDKLLLAGYYCGLGLEAGAAIGSAKLACTTQPTGIRLCFESKLVVDVAWPAEVATVKQLFGAMPAAQVKSVRSSCEIPAVKNDGRPL